MGVRLIAGVFALALLAGLSASNRAQADPAITGYPDSIASLGDSTTQARNSVLPEGDHPENSWSVGDQPFVNSYYSRLASAHPAITGNLANYSVSGAKMSQLNGQAQLAVAQNAELVMILMGNNDICTPSVATMTPVATFQAQFEAAMDTLSAGLTDARIAVMSTPNPYFLWELLKDDPQAQAQWSARSLCQSLLEDPTSTDPDDVQRRADVAQRIIDLNLVLRDVCAQYVHCRFDNFAGVTTQFSTAHISTIDYFHASVVGLALLAQVAWDSLFDWSDQTAPVSDSSADRAPSGPVIELTATDNTAVSGIEYHTGAGWERFSGPFFLARGNTLTWRAVDVNGNVEATHTCYLSGGGWENGDDDCDGYKTATELVIGTDPYASCGSTPGSPQSDAWPADLMVSERIDIIDVLTFKPIVLGPDPNTVPPQPARFDLSPDGVIDIVDVLTMKRVFGANCVP
jgi:hypothetical protein